MGAVEIGRGGVCSVCDGKGVRMFNQPKAKRIENAEKARIRKAEKMENNLAAFEESHPELKEWWTNSSFDFAVSLRNQASKYGELSEKQLQSANNCIERNKEREKARESANRNAAAVDLSSVAEVFNRAKSNGYKSPVLRLAMPESEAALRLSRAPDSGVNAGAIYVKVGDEYMGKVLGGKFIKSHACSAEVESNIIKAVDNPLEAARLYGHRTGICSCCGRALTNGESIDLGIGPICREKFFG